MGITGLGDPLSRRLVVICHAAPGAGAFDPDPLVTNEWGVRIVAPDRPGYGSSDPLDPGDDPVATWVADMSDYLSWVGLNAGSASIHSTSFGVIGWGAGSLFAVAFAAWHPELVDRLVLVEPPAGGCPVPDGVMGSGPGRQVRHRPGSEGLADRWAYALEESQRQGTIGLDTDRLAAEGGMDPEAVACIDAETLLVCDDTDESLAAGRWYHRRLGSSRGLRVPRSEGAAIVAAWPRILAHVAPDHGGVPAQLRSALANP